MNNGQHVKIAENCLKLRDSKDRKKWHASDSRSIIAVNETPLKDTNQTLEIESQIKEMNIMSTYEENRRLSSAKLSLPPQ
jgi:hypothetical protein